MAARARSFYPVAPSSSIGGVVPAWLEARLGSPSVRILDVRAFATSRRGPPAAFAHGHVPGAVPLDVRATLFDDAGDVVSAPELALVMSGLGVGDGHTVVIVDEGWPESGIAAAKALIRYGHPDVHVLEGGFTRWVAEGRPVSRAIVRHPPASFTARVPS
jgi:thiosulfate/3-mercaptopyruvate sulfurtransferase